MCVVLDLSTKLKEKQRSNDSEYVQRATEIGEDIITNCEEKVAKNERENQKTSNRFSAFLCLTYYVLQDIECGQQPDDLGEEVMNMLDGLDNVLENKGV